MPQDRSIEELSADEGGAAEALRRAFRFALGHPRPSDSDTEALHAAACDYVRALRDRDVPPETAVVAVKDILRRALMGHTPTHDSRRAAESLIERVVTWCIEEYYRPQRGERGISA